MNTIENLVRAAMACAVYLGVIKRNWSGEITALKQLRCELMTQGQSPAQYLADIGALELLTKELMQDYYDHLMVETQGRICPTMATLIKSLYRRDFGVELDLQSTCSDYDLMKPEELPQAYWLEGVEPTALPLENYQPLTVVRRATWVARDLVGPDAARPATRVEVYA